jgi:GINS complex subunit 1
LGGARARSGGLKPGRAQFELVDQALGEVRDHHEAIHHLAGMDEVREKGMESPEVTSSLYMLHETILRDKRCLLAYCNARLQRIKNYRWEVGRASPELLARMSPAEREFLETYETLLGDYDLQEDGSFLDLFVDMKPPKDPHIKVRVKRTLGDLHFRWLGSVSLEKGAVVTLPRDEAERLILEGLLEDFEE